MKVIALGILSGAVGERVKGEEFAVSAETGADLINRGLVRAADEPQAIPKKAEPAKE
jgi:hypothetical protein